MGFIDSLLGKVAGEAINAGVEYGKNKLAENKAAKEAQIEAEKAQIEAELDSYIGGAFRLPEGFCSGANGRVWRAQEREGTLFLLCKKGRKSSYSDEEWFELDDILEYYEDI